MKIDIALLDFRCAQEVCDSQIKFEFPMTVINKNGTKTTSDVIYDKYQYLDYLITHKKEYYGILEPTIQNKLQRTLTILEEVIYKDIGLLHRLASDLMVLEITTLFNIFVRSGLPWNIGDQQTITFHQGVKNV